ncbi:hypothetical protein [Tsukamurella paurometabola]|uniref:Ribbon-helix-helix protein CopG domain-containing protein n=1 Tax=Tsukamurella paurometabola TaxID=2061 RepID=A0ABS5NGD8_TSUPA|nr:hypothetical protein [Tsukamurella paurometabola]MBS4103090.1 hypothetical protein [Tsukamurella paurometabola]
MAEPLRRTQAVRLTHDERENLRNLAQRNGLSSGILARALLLWARENIPPRDLNAIIASAKAEVAARASAAGTAAINARWAMTKHEDDKEN